VHCPKCGHDNSKVIESRDTGDAVRRRRECLNCGNRYTTYERIESPNLAVMKKDKRRELFDRDKLKRAIYQSVGKFLHGEIEAEEIVSRVEDELYGLGESEINSRQIGDAVMTELARRNEVAYIRFASVYREFQNADEFVAALRELRENPDCPEEKSGSKENK
jgi:transcriptional repressor NrdR